MKRRLLYCLFPLGLSLMISEGFATEYYPEARAMEVYQQQKGKGNNRQNKKQEAKKGNEKKEVKQVPKDKKQEKPGPVRKK